MQLIKSFQVDHVKLLKGLYVSTYQKIGNETITTFDIRLCRPNIDKVLNTGTCHVIEHIGATFLRNHPIIASDIIYFGPMGCRTGFYLIMSNKLDSVDILDLVIELFVHINFFEGDIPGASPKECGNYMDMDLDGAKVVSREFLEILKNATDSNLKYPE